jgi:CRP/FNR family transcriptional regulator
MERERLMQIITCRGVLGRGWQLFHAGDPLRSLYVLRSGSIKSWTVTQNGDDRVIRFHLPGDVLGLGAIGSDRHDCNATTLDTCSVCEIPFNRFQKLAQRIPSLHLQLLRRISLELVHEERMTLLRWSRRAPTRLAGFLVQLAQDFELRGYSNREFYLTMGRRDIANYLGLALETVSRTLSHFQDEGLLRVEGKYIRVTDRQRLTEISGPQDANIVTDNFALHASVGGC